MHLKSTHGEAAAGLRHTTELVVDEIALAPWRDQQTGGATGDEIVAWLSACEPPPELARDAKLVRGTDVGVLLRSLEMSDASALGRVDAAVVDSLEQIDAVIRPRRDAEVSLVRPCGEIRLHPRGPKDDAPLASALRELGLCLTTSRCGDFAAAIAAMERDTELQRLGERMVTDRVPARDVAHAFARARSRDCIKVVVEHAD